ncbi:MAG: DUF3800 domain-containing protein [Pseudomonadota bacterium]|nr:DUF3800 domain-containing protein [Pseudomonadota bacterium]
MQDGQRKYAYVAYIDESGDDGLARVRPIDNNGASEWLVLAAVVVRAEREPEIVDWVRQTTSKFKNFQSREGIHFSKLSSAKKLISCEDLASRPVRIFTVCSNKKNMRGYRNPFAEKIPSKNWFYCWMTRLLLERVTFWTKRRSLYDFGEVRKLKIEYSERGGLSYTQMNAYYQWLRYKSTGGQFLPLGDIAYEVIDFDLLKIYNHAERAGLQLADVAASAYFRACDIHGSGSCDTRFAKALMPRMALSPEGLMSGYSVKLMPSWRKANLLSSQEEIFRFYGYPNKQWWAPGSV